MNLSEIFNRKLEEMPSSLNSFMKKYLYKYTKAPRVYYTESFFTMIRKCPITRCLSLDMNFLYTTNKK